MNWKKLFTEKNIRALIFDFDQTIADTEQLHMDKWNLVLKPYGINISLKEFAKNYCGKSSTKEIPQLLKKNYGDKIPLSADEIAERASEIMKNLFETREVKLMPKARESMLFFIGFKLGVCSGVDPLELELKLVSVGLNKFFPKSYRSTQSEAGGLGKPHPAMYRLLTKRLEVSPEQCIVFEDTESGVKSAAEAGMFVIAMPTIYSQGQDFSRADVVIEGGWPTFMQEVHDSFYKSKGN